MLKNLGRLWGRWIKIATFIGNIQMAVLLSVIYFTMVAVTAIPMRILSDPLALRRSGQGWTKRDQSLGSVEEMRKQG